MLIDWFGIQRLLSVSGGSMGGMQALEWAVSYPDRVVSSIPIATTARHSAQQIAFNEVGRQAIMADPDWNEGNYYGKQPPARGLAVARMVGHITYMSDESMREKFGRRLRGKENFGFGFDVDFEVESYLRYRGSQFVNRFDANSYLFITKAMDYFDLTNGTVIADRGAGAGAGALPGDQLQLRLALPQLPVPGNGAGPPRAQLRRGLCGAATPTTATIPSWWTWRSRPTWSADSWPARSRRCNERQAPGKRLSSANCWDAAITPSSATLWSRAPRCSTSAAAKASCSSGWRRTRACRAAAWRSPASRCSGPSARGVSVYQGDIDEGLADYPDQAFDYVILSQTLQETLYPRHVLQDMLRVGRRVIVAFPNFGHWRCAGPC